MALEIMIKSSEGKAKALTKSQFLVAEKIIVAMMNGEMKAKVADAKVIEACAAAGDPIDFSDAIK